MGGDNRPPQRPRPRPRQRRLLRQHLCVFQKMEYTQSRSENIPRPITKRSNHQNRIQIDTDAGILAVCSRTIQISGINKINTIYIHTYLYTYVYTPENAKDKDENDETDDETDRTTLFFIFVGCID